MTVFYQGEKYAYSYLAAKKYFLDEIELNNVEKFESLFIKVEQNKQNLAILPIENSLAGAVTENINYLIKYKTQIVGEIYLPIHHCLVAKKEAKMSEITQVFSHQKALEQCDRFLANHPNMKQIAYSNTAAAAKMISESKNPKLSAISSKEAAKEYGLQILQENIQDNSDNWTRFVIISQKSVTRNDFFDKCSISFVLSHQSGSLAKVLQCLAENEFNLTNIISKPIAGKFFEYVFFVEFEFDQNKQGILKKVLFQLEKLCQSIQLLGVYKRGGELKG